MIKLHKLIATFFGIGYIGKGGGTIAAAVLCIAWLLLHDYMTPTLQVLITALVSIVGIWSGNVLDPLWGKDSNKVVIDEVAGMMVTLLLLPVNLTFVGVGLVLFRFFDILKPLGVKKMEMLPKGWGVMGDDILAGIYAHLILMVIVHFAG